MRDELTKFAFRRRLRFYEREARDDRGYAFLVFSTANDVLIGGVTLSNVRRGVSQSAMLGYWLGVNYVGHGLMTRAVGAVLPFVLIRSSCIAWRRRPSLTTGRLLAFWSVMDFSWKDD